jgi:predicted secreted protein
VLKSRCCGIGISAVPSLPKAVKGVRLPYPALLKHYRIKVYDHLNYRQVFRQIFRQTREKIQERYPPKSRTHSELSLSYSNTDKGANHVLEMR